MIVKRKTHRFAVVAVEGKNGFVSVASGVGGLNINVES